MATTEHYGITEINGTADISNIPINQAFEKIDSEMWKLFQFRGNLGSSDSLNNLDGIGIWRIGDSAPLNAPPSPMWAFVLQVVYGTLTHQYFFKPEARAVFIRSYSGSPQVWSDWIYIGGYVAPVRIDYGTNSYVEYWKSGQTACVYVHYNVTDGALNAWGNKQLATLPEGFRPAQVVAARGLMDRAADEGAYVSVTSSGTVILNTKYNSFAASGGMLNVYITYPIRY